MGGKRRSLSHACGCYQSTTRVDCHDGEAEQSSSVATAAGSTSCRSCLSDESVQSFRIAIVGTGLAGLSTALSLERVGYRNIALYERDASFDARKEGYGLTLTYDPKGILDKLNVLDEIANADCPSRSHYLFDSSGRVQGYFGNAFYNLQQQQPTTAQQQQSGSTCNRPRRGYGQRGNLRVPRQTVRKILLDKLKHSKIEWGHKFTDIRHCNDEMELIFECHRMDDAPADDESSPSPPTRQIVVKTDLVVAADGIHSRVLNSWIPRLPPPTSLRVRLILGLSRGFVHPLLDERGFYTTEPGMRLFVMPFAGSRLDPVKERRFMWQLSFAAETATDDDDHQPQPPFSSQQLLDQALSMCREWHAPVLDLMRATPVSTVWGTLLCDRDPMLIYQQLKDLPCQRVIVVGDALHAMSPFKGQGANQALQDGRVVAQWLDPSHTSKTKTRRLSKAVQSCVRELTQRTQKVVHASRLTSQFWHASLTTTTATTHDHHPERGEHFKFAGIPSGTPMRTLLTALDERQIRAGLCPNLDQAIAQVLLDDENTIPKTKEKNPVNQSSSQNVSTTIATMAEMDPTWVASVWESIQQGDLGRLRRLSWEGQRSSCFLAHLRDADTGNTLLHVAVTHGGRGAASSSNVLAWLVREAGCDLQARNSKGQTPMDLVVVTSSNDDACCCSNSDNDDSSFEKDKRRERSQTKLFLERLTDLEAMTAWS